jgi:heme A synthase
MKAVLRHRWKKVLTAVVTMAVMIGLLNAFPSVNQSLVTVAAVVSAIMTVATLTRKHEP